MINLQHIPASQIKVAFSTDILAREHILLAFPDFCKVLHHPARTFADGLSDLCGYRIFRYINLNRTIWVDMYSNLSSP